MVPRSRPNSMSNLSRSQSSERMHVVSAPISATCVCRRLVPSNIWISLFLTSDAEEPGGSAIAARTVAARAAATRRVIRARETTAGALAVTARDAGKRGGHRAVQAASAPNVTMARRSGGSSGREGFSRSVAGWRASGPGRRVCPEPPAETPTPRPWMRSRLWQPSST